MEHFSEQTGLTSYEEQLLGTKHRVDHTCNWLFRLLHRPGFREADCRTAAGERLHAPDLVHLVKAEFAAGTGFLVGPQTFAGIVFDSAIQPVAAGLRAARAATRQVIYEAEGLTVDLRFERKQQGNMVSACGQVLDKEAPLCWLNNAAILLCTHEGRMVTRTETNEYGEFQVEFEPQEQLRMSVVTMGRDFCGLLWEISINADYPNNKRLGY
jgi:hypothetical protein